MLNNARLTRTELLKLTPAHLDAWRQALKTMPTRSDPSRGAMRSYSTLNRDMTCLRAALNLAYLDGLTTSDFAWRGKLRPVKNADQRSEPYLDKTQRSSFIESAAADCADFLSTQMAMLSDGTTTYNLRHNVISDLVHYGLDLLTVALMSGACVTIVERHRGHLRADVATFALAKLAF